MTTKKKVLFLEADTMRELLAKIATVTSTGWKLEKLPHQRKGKWVAVLSI